MKINKRKFLLLALFLYVMLISATSNAMVIGGKNGKYKGKQLTTNGYEVRCGWQFWMDCFNINCNGNSIWIEFGDGTIDRLCMPAIQPTTNDPNTYSTKVNSFDDQFVRPMFKTQSDDPNDAGCQTCFDYIYYFPPYIEP